METINIQKEKLTGFINNFIIELEDQDTTHVEIVDLLLMYFDRNTLEELGFTEFIDDYFQESHLDNVVADATARSKNDVSVSQKNERELDM